MPSLRNGDASGSADRIRSRVRGCLVGGAIGDALGAPVEFLNYTGILAKYGPLGVTRFSPAYGRIGAITDDTQMTLFTAEGLLRAQAQKLDGGAPDPAAAAYGAYQRWLLTQGETDAEVRPDSRGWLLETPELHHLRSPGMTCLTSLQAHRLGTRQQPLNGSKGCGGVMRAAPAGLFVALDAAQSFELGCDLAAITHGHPSGYLPAGALAMIVRHLLDGYNLPSALEQSIVRLQAEEPPDKNECSEALEGALSAWRRACDTLPTLAEHARAIERLGGGWTGEQALAIGAYAALVFQDSFDDGIRLAVNHSGDSDSTGSIAGNILGALLGEEAIAAEWIEQLELAETIVQIADDIVDAGYGRGDWLTRYPAA